MPGLVCLGMAVLAPALPGPLPSAQAANAPTTSVSTVAPARAPGPLRIMAVGDSITHGYAGDATWRYFVDRELRRQGVAHEFVGPWTGPRPRMQEPGDYLWPFQTAHASMGHTTLDDHLPMIEGRVRTHRPDVVVIGLGWNDVRQGDSARRVRNQTVELVRRVRLAAPGARIVLGEITDHTGWPRPTTTLRQRPVDHRARMRPQDRRGEQANRLVAKAFAGDPLVEVARIRTGARPWNPWVHTTDGTHPNLRGQAFLADAYNKALRQVGVLPERPARAPVRTWALPGVSLRPKAMRVVRGPKGRRALALRVPDLTGSVHYQFVDVRVVNRSTGRVTHFSVTPARARRFKVPVTPGRLDVRLNLRRKYQPFAVGPQMRVRVPGKVRQR